jgi:hypothetical protein
MKGDPFMLYLRFLASFDNDGNAYEAIMQCCRTQFTLSAQPWLFPVLDTIVSSKFLPSLQELLVLLLSTSSLTDVREELVFHDILVFLNGDSISDETRATFLTKAKDEMSLAQQPWIINCIHNIKEKNLVFYDGLKEVGITILLANNNFSTMSGSQIYACYERTLQSSLDTSSHDEVQVLLDKIQTSNIAFNVIVDFIILVKQLPDERVHSFHLLLVWARSAATSVTLSADSMIQLLVWLAGAPGSKMSETIAVLVHSIESNWDLVTAILDDAGIRQAIQQDNQDLIELCRRRVRSLSMKANPPPFTWSFTNASHRESSIQTFLRGPLQTLIISNQFHSIRHARRYENQLRGNKRPAYFTTAASGAGNYAKVTLIKTRVYYENLVAECQKAEQKMKELQGLLTGKRQREEEVTIVEPDKRVCPSTAISGSAVASHDLSTKVSTNQTISMSTGSVAVARSLPIAAAQPRSLTPSAVVIDLTMDD